MGEHGQENRYVLFGTFLFRFVHAVFTHQLLYPILTGRFPNGCNPAILADGHQGTPGIK